MKNKILIGYIIVFVGELLAITFDIQLMEWIFKPLIMLTLLGFYYSAVNRETEYFSKQVVFAILLSWIGDIALMLQSFNDNLFIVGLGSFLFAHLFYILAYRQHRFVATDKILMGIQKFRFAFPIVLAGTGLITILYSHLGDLKIPVIIYAVVLIVMVLESLFRYGYSHSRSFWFVFLGALFFLVSDSSIAIQKFLGTFSSDHILVMSTYMTAQFLIVSGLVHHSQQKKGTEN